MICFVSQLITSNLENEQNFKKIRISFLVSTWSFEVSIEDSFPYIEVSDRCSDVRGARTNGKIL